MDCGRVVALLLLREVGELFVYVANLNVEVSFLFFNGSGLDFEGFRVHHGDVV